MSTLSNTTGSKKVKIIKDASGIIRACFVQVYKNEEDLIELKSFANEKNAEKWAKKKLN
jgi:hypothetical protein